MAYEGYFRLAGVEIANAARTAAYVGSLMPTFGLADCTDCEGLLQALGQDRYTTPAQDGAPWVDSSNPGLNDFWGVYPLGVSGIDDSTRTASVTELTGDGSVVSLPRRAGREMRFDALLVGKDKHSVMEGFHWLDRALDGVRCDDRTLGCTGAPLEFFSSCPPACDYSGCPDIVADLSSESTDGWHFSGDRPQGQYLDSVVSCPDGATQMPGIMVTDSGPSTLTATRVMSGLIPGGWYKFEASLTGFNDLPVVSIRGADASIVATVTSYETNCNDASLTTLWFQAHSPVMYLDITTEPQGLETIKQLTIWNFSVFRADPANDIYKTTWENDGSALNGWEPGYFTNANTDIQRNNYNNFFTTMRWWISDVNDGGQMAIFSEDGYFLRRTLRGLTPGQRYIARFSGSLYMGDLNQDEASVRLRVDGIAEEEVILDTADVAGPLGLSVEFVATASQHTVTIMPGSVAMYLEPDAVFSQDIELSLFSLAIEAVSDGLPPYPDAALPYRRTLYRTTALTGPTIEERYDKACGYMLRVSFGLQSGIPDQYGDLVDAGSALNQSSFITGNFECIGDEQVRTNLIMNPSGEDNALLTPWVGYNLDSTLVAGATPGVARFGDGYFAVTLDAPGAASFTGIAYDFDSLIPVIPGSFIFSAYVGGNVGANTFAELEVTVLDPGENPMTTLSSVPIPIPASSEGEALTRISFPFTVSDLASGLQPAIRLSNNSDPNWDPNAIIDGILLESGNALLPYFDGSFPNSEWDGAPNQSESVYTPSTVSTLIDPDCPPLPTPPQPPSIEEACVSEPVAWLRYAIEVPGSQIPLYSSVRPVITIISGDQAVRQVRTRWYPNPEGAEVSQLRQCDFVGEMLASYVPPNSEFTIDGIAQDATSVAQDGSIGTATHLLYGPDMGPVEWPELSCNVPYVFTVDVEATGDLTEVDVILQLGLKV